MSAPLRRALFALLLLPACGGSEAGGRAPNAADGESASGDCPASREGDELGDASDEDEGTANTEPPKARCDDGTCTPCGDSLCPVGWYCDESASGGAACGWLPECATKASCGCVKRAFGGCSCEDQAGTAHVRCG